MKLYFIPVVISVAIMMLMTSSIASAAEYYSSTASTVAASGATYSAIPANTSTNVQDAITKASTFKHAYCSDHSTHSIYSAAGWTVAPTAETTLATCTITGGNMGTNGLASILFLMSNQNSANNKILKVKSGSILFWGPTLTTTATVQSIVHIRNRNSESSQIAFQAGLLPFSSSTNANVTSSINTALDWPILFTAQTTTESGVQTTSLSGNGTTCTAVKASHGYLAGEYIQVSSGSNCDTSGNPNTTIAQIATAVTNTFTYPCSCSGAESGTQPTAYRYSNIQLESYDLEISKP